MGMLSEPRVRGRHIRAKWEALQRSNESLSTQIPSGSDSSVGLGIAQKLMKNWGWEDGQGLGASNQGLAEPIKLHQNFDSRGVGYTAKRGEEQKDQAAHFQKFESVLAALSAVHSNKEKDEVCTNSPGGSDGGTREDRPKRTRNHLHYHKFAQAKDVSQYSREDLECVLGAKAHALYSNILKEEQAESSENFTVSELNTTEYFGGLQDSGSTSPGQDPDVRPSFGAENSCIEEKHSEEIDDAVQKNFEQRMANGYAACFVAADSALGSETSTGEVIREENVAVDVDKRSRKKKKKKAEKSVDGDDSESPCTVKQSEGKVELLKSELVVAEKENCVENGAVDVEKHSKKKKKKKAEKSVDGDDSESPCTAKQYEGKVELLKSEFVVAEQENRVENGAVDVEKRLKKKKKKKVEKSVDGNDSESPCTAEQSEGKVELRSELVAEKENVASLGMKVESAGVNKHQGVERREENPMQEPFAVPNKKKKNRPGKDSSFNNTNETVSIADKESLTGINSSSSTQSKEKSKAVITRVDFGSASLDVRSSIWAKYAHRYATSFVKGDTLPGSTENSVEEPKLDSTVEETSMKGRKKMSKRKGEQMNADEDARDSVMRDSVAVENLVAGATEIKCSNAAGSFSKVDDPKSSKKKRKRSDSVVLEACVDKTEPQSGRKGEVSEGNTAVAVDICVDSNALKKRKKNKGLDLKICGEVREEERSALVAKECGDGQAGDAKCSDGRFETETSLLVAPEKKKKLKGGSSERKEHAINEILEEPCIMREDLQGSGHSKRKKKSKKSRNLDCESGAATHWSTREADVNEAFPSEGMKLGEEHNEQPITETQQASQDGTSQLKKKKKSSQVVVLDEPQNRVLLEESDSSEKKKREKKRKRQKTDIDEESKPAVEEKHAEDKRKKKKKKHIL